MRTRYNNFGKAKFKYRQLDLRLLVAGELNITCHGVVSEMETEARLRLLGDVFYSTPYQWPALLTFHAAVLSGVEKGTAVWEYDHSHMEQQMLMPCWWSVNDRIHKDPYLTEAVGLRYPSVDALTKFIREKGAEQVVLLLFWNVTWKGHTNRYLWSPETGISYCLARKTVFWYDNAYGSEVSGNVLPEAHQCHGVYHEIMWFRFGGVSGWHVDSRVLGLSWNLFLHITGNHCLQWRPRVRQ